MGIANFIKEDISSEKTFEKKITDKATISESNVISISAPCYEDPSKADSASSNSDKLNMELEQDIDNRKKSMVVISNTVSTKDYKQIQKNGFSVEESDSAIIVSESDKIKAALAKQGVDISKYGGLSSEVLESIAGSPELALQMAAAFKNNDIPINEDNISDMTAAMKKVEGMSELSTDSAVYMVKNQLPPTIDNLYKAQYVGTGYSNIKGMSDSDFNQLSPQVEELIKSSGMTADENNMNYARLLLDNGVEITAENIEYVDNLLDLTQNLADMEPSKIYDSMATAISEGGKAGDGKLLSGYSIIDQAQKSFYIINNATEEDIDYIISNGQDVNISNIERASKADKSNLNAIEDNLKSVTAKRQLEETRLMMTVDANYSLIKKGIMIDTKPLVDLVEDLKNLEKQFYKDLLSGSGVVADEGNINSFAETTRIVSEIKYQPAYALTLASAEETFNTIYSRSSVMQVDFEKANQSYETMMTAPRSDMGDNISKAFRNVDDIIEDLGLEITVGNQRAVRILAYNEITLTEDNIHKIKAVDEQVQRAFKNMTPATTLEMIRQGKSPLDMSIEQLNETAEKIQSENPNNESERFSKFLYKLEHNKEISEEERDSYIGIYRLIAQVQNTDGAAIGSLIHQGADITMRNLLTAVRNSKKGKMDYTVDDNFEGVDSIIKGPRIDEQVEAAYNLNCLRDVMDDITRINSEILSTDSWENMTPEQLKEYVENIDEESLEQDELLENEYAKSKLAEFEEIKAVSDDVYRFLDRYDIKNSMANILAASKMLRNPSIPLRKLWKDLEIPDSAAEMIDQMKNQVLQQFGEAVKNPQEMADAQEALAEIATHAMDAMIIEGKDVTAQDIKELRMLNRQLQLCSNKAKEESYMIPIETNEGVSGVSLKVIRGEKDKGFVDIFFRGELMGKIAASFEAKENGASGVIAVSDNETRQLISDNLGILVDKINPDGNEPVDIKVALIPDLSSEQFEISLLHKEEQFKKLANKVSLGNNKESEYISEDNYKVQTSRLYSIAEGIIQTIIELNE